MYSHSCLQLSGVVRGCSTISVIFSLANKNRTWYLLKSICDVNLLSKLSIIFKEWRDTRTFSSLKSTHCTLVIWLIINLVRKQCSFDLVYNCPASYLLLTSYIFDQLLKFYHSIETHDNVWCCNSWMSSYYKCISSTRLMFPIYLP
jgi:hypothetical protein